jgi:PKD repeat protein
VVTVSSDAAALAQSLVGSGLQVSNAVLTGASGAAGSFAFQDPTVLGFSQGLVLGSGSVVDVVGPNTYDDTTTDWSGAGDADLTALAGYDSLDAVVLEFDFVPTANQVVFQYAFASEEYSEWVASPFNDVFAFFVNGTNHAEVRQVAGDPTAPFVPVAVNNINNGNPFNPDAVPMRPDLYRDNALGSATPIDLEPDGVTHVLTFQAPVVADATNHMKLALADASDHILDSSVFIQAGSIVSNENPVADLSLSTEAGAAPLPLTAFVEGEDPNGLPLTYSLDWGDGTSPATGSLPDETTQVDHTYAYGGHYTATLTVSNGTLSGTSTEDVEVTGDVQPPDTTAPDLAPSFDATMPFLRGSTVTASANATDASGIATESCDQVDTAAIGSFSVTCRATDNVGNPASISVPYTVGLGVAQVSPTDGSTFKRTASIPVSFQLVDTSGAVPDSDAVGLRSLVTVTFDGRTGVHPSYDKRRNLFTASLKTGKPLAGGYDVTITLVLNGTTLAERVIPVTVV